YKATGNKAALDYAIQLYDLIEKYSCDTLNGGYIEALSRDWKPLEDMRLSDKDANEPKSMNTHLHILEPYINLYRVWKSEVLATKIRGLIGIFQEHIINHKTDHFQLFFDYNWNVKSDIVSYGHDIEGAWLLVEAAYELGDANLVKAVERQCVRLVDATIAEGLASDGSIYNEKNGLHLDDDRHWWPQAEAMVGFVYAWKITGEERYLEKLMKTWNYIFTHIIDKENGEWFWRCDNAGRPNLEDVKLGFWKCPYQKSRAEMEVILIIQNGI
ncbi:MAG: AGE family epimerase/isomerase, partial [Bacteroidales bacterium]|nr:AGE family epimerase/isomerase [Bacteroidales bacterium]